MLNGLVIKLTSIWMKIPMFIEKMFKSQTWNLFKIYEKNDAIIWQQSVDGLKVCLL